MTVVLVPGITWFVLNSLRKAGTKLIAPDEKVHIVIQNLVKIYDRQGRFSREWESGKKIRRRAGLEKEYRSISEFDHLIWQLPLLGFMVYFTFFYLGRCFLDQLHDGDGLSELEPDLETDCHLLNYRQDETGKRMFRSDQKI